MSVLFTAKFDGHPITVLQIRGRCAFLPHEIGVAAGYMGDGQRFVDQIVHHWAEGLEDDEHIAQLVGKELDVLKREVPLPPTTNAAIVLFAIGAEQCLLRSHARATRRLITFLHEEVLSRVVAYHHANTPAVGGSDDEGDGLRVPPETSANSAFHHLFHGESQPPSARAIGAAVAKIEGLSKRIDRERRQEGYRAMIRLAEDLRQDHQISDEQWAALRVEAVEELLGRNVRASLPPFGLDTLIPPRAA